MTLITRGAFTFREALGVDANLLIRAISNLSPFLDDDSQLARVDTH
jgi:hypothetical protein